MTFVGGIGKKQRSFDRCSRGIESMRLNPFNLAIVLCAFTVGAGAQQISGTILIKKRLTKKNVTASVSVYQRGATVKLGQDAEEEPIAYEMSRVVVYLEGPPPSQDASGGPASPAQIQQVDRRFQPDLVVVPAGSSVSFPNMDPIFHSVFSLSKAKAFDLGSYDKGETRKVLFSKPGIVDVYCHLHPNMTATVVVTPNHFYARVDRTGHYQIPDVPAGQYTVVAWHKTAGFFRKAVVIGDGHDAVADFFIPLGDGPKQEVQSRDNQGQDGGTR
jgi:plastocyanin